LFAASIFSKLAEPASSSPSNANLILDFVLRPAARMASSAVIMASMGALSSPAARAYSRHSGLNGVPGAGSGITRPSFSIGASRSVGVKGGVAHSLGSSGCPS
jgi:hypothetical protein